MTDLQEAQWKKIENEIFTAFKNVELEDGIGYHEAGAIDDYYKPTDSAYIEEKNKDERYDWTKLLVEFDNRDLDSCRHCFMDAKGLLFYLPVLLIRQEEAVNWILHFYISELYKRQGYSKSEFTKTLSLMTKEQKHCIFLFYDFLSKVEDSEFAESYLNMGFDYGEQQLKNFKFLDFIKETFQQL